MNYVYAGYAVGFGGVALYAVRVVLRGRALRRALGLSPGAATSSAAGTSPGASSPPAPPAPAPMRSGAVAGSTDAGSDR